MNQRSRPPRDIAYPDTWGPGFWNTAHCAAAGYPESPDETDRARFRAFYDSMAHVLPCKECRENWSSVLERRPLSDADLEHRAALSTWVFDVHNLVNEKLGKPAYGWPQLLRRFPGLDPEPVAEPVAEPVVKVKRRIYTSQVVPDTSLGTVQLKTPTRWRGVAMMHAPTPRASVARETAPPPADGIARAPARKRCGCAK